MLKYAERALPRPRVHKLLKFYICDPVLILVCSSFKGHYIVVLGCDMAGGAVAYMDPTCDGIRIAYICSNVIDNDE